MPIASLSTLRRLYHHVIHGGTLRPIDIERTGGAATAEEISRVIQRLEREQLSERLKDRKPRNPDWVDDVFP